MKTTDLLVDLGGGELIELAVSPGTGILLRSESGGAEIDVALLPHEAEELIEKLRLAVSVAKSVS